MMPSADQVAHALVVAAEEMRVHPEEVVGERKTLMPVAAARARSYAAMALDRVFNGDFEPDKKHMGYPLSRVAIARMVGVPEASRDGFVHAMESKLKRNLKVGWWRPATFDRVVKAIRKAGDPGPAPKAAPAPEREPEKRPPVRRDTVTSVARPRAPEPPQAKLEAIPERPRPAPPVAKPAPVVKSPVPGGVRTERNGVSMDPTAWRITRKGTTVELRDADAYLVTQQLLKVMPALLPTQNIVDKVWGHSREGSYRVGSAVDRANVVLARIGLKIKALPKFGFALSEV